MRIAIPTNDLTTISAHLGRTKGFMVYDVDDNQITNFQYILNTFTGHAKNKGKHHEHGTHNHSHDSILNTLGKCQVVIAGGMGQRMYNDFTKNNIQVFITQESSINQALEQYLNGVLEHNAEHCCNH